MLCDLAERICHVFFLIIGASPVLVSHAFSQTSEIQTLQKDSLKKVETLLNDKGFKDVISNLETKASCSVKDLSFGTISKSEGSFSLESQLESSSCFSFPSSHLQENKIISETQFYIFVSLSLEEKALLNLAIDAKRYGATLVLRGFINGSYVETAKALQKIIQEADQGFIIDPELFTLFSITAVPTFILAKPFQLNTLERIQTPLHDRIQGHISAQYALETFAKEGSLSEEAKVLLAKSPLGKGELK
ncbi:MAG: type-F conjugative transfer system pilin assembly protein TrbC [Alphaproteobacteria bacterium 41-28]|nr:MAG: type-F conjugative transfer system pilin assembly protein TrbC [Alphaproteobacteria bacterium 41-28]